MKIRWVQFIGIVSCFLCVIWLIGFGLAFTNYFYKGTTTVSQLDVVSDEEIFEEAEQGEFEINEHGNAEKGEINLENSETSFLVVALGDSLTVGMGDAEGKGYVGNVIDDLHERKIKDIHLENLGVNGLTSNGLLEIVSQPDVEEQIKQAKLILLTIGGNDLFQSGQTLINVNREEIDLLEQAYLENIKQIFTQIRALNIEAPIYLSGLYNPFIEFSESQITSEIIVDWNYKTALEVGKYSKAIFVPTFDLFQLNVNDFLAEDRFHPNTNGYEQMALRIVSLLAWVGDDQS
ncbi:GDSL-type esterase/lipase family protein [Bacillaceae bacterium IKA-2]|nr:GDSL-type esterase/lipase family protein [Bacillaceae bacterium IKA-2]